MSTIHAMKCDGCGTIAEGYHPHGWYKIVRKGATLSMDLEWHFCSDVCFKSLLLDKVMAPDINLKVIA